MPFLWYSKAIYSGLNTFKAVQFLLHVGNKWATHIYITNKTKCKTL